MDVFKFKNLSAFGDIKHGISTKKFGSIKNEDNSINKGSLEKFITGLGLPKAEVLMHQVHGADVAIVSDNNTWQIQDVDGLITNKKDIPLCVIIADCLPVLFFDKKNHVVGIAHGGRKGLIRGILENMVSKFIDEYKSDPADILVGIGPGIEKDCYEVDGELTDIRKIAIDRLLSGGIRRENIESIDLCTKDKPDLFYSYRGGDSYKRFVAVLSLT